MNEFDMPAKVEELRKTIKRLKDKKSQYEERLEELRLEITLHGESISKLNDMIERYQRDLNGILRQITIIPLRSDDK